MAASWIEKQLSVLAFELMIWLLSLVCTLANCE